MPTRILATPAELGRLARKSYVKKSGRRARGALVQGKRTGFAHPAPSRVPVGSLETKVQRQAERVLTPNENGQVITLNSSIAVGTQVYNRIGHKFRTTACRIKGWAFSDINADRAAIWGYAFVWDKSPNGVLPLVSDIFTINATSGYDMSNTMLVDDNSDRFTVLKSVRKPISKTYTSTVNAPSNQSSTGNAPNLGLIDDFLKLPPWAVTSYTKQATAGTGTIAAHMAGALYIVPFVRNISGSGTVPTSINFTAELFFAEG